MFETVGIHWRSTSLPESDAMRVQLDEIEHDEYTGAELNGMPFTGTAFRSNEDGIVVEECEFRDGALHGVRREFFNNGSLRWFQHYCDGDAEGEEGAFFPSGRLESTAFCRANLLMSRIAFGDNGQKVEEYDWKRGICTEWRLDGTLRKITLREPKSNHPYPVILEERYFDANGQPTIVHTGDGWKMAKQSKSTD